MFTRESATHAATGFARDARSACNRMNPSVPVADRTNHRSCIRRITCGNVQIADNHCTSRRRNARNAGSCFARTVLRRLAKTILSAQYVVLSSILSAPNVATPLQPQTNFVRLVVLRFRNVPLAPPPPLRKAALPHAYLSHRQPGFLQSGLRYGRFLGQAIDRDRPSNHGR